MISPLYCVRLCSYIHTYIYTTHLHCIHMLQRDIYILLACGFMLTHIYTILAHIHIHVRKHMYILVLINTLTRRSYTQMQPQTYKYEYAKIYAQRYMEVSFLTIILGYVRLRIRCLSS